MEKAQTCPMTLEAVIPVTAQVFLGLLPEKRWAEGTENGCFC